MGKVLVVRYGAFGDQIYISPLLRTLAEEGYAVDLECNWKGLQIHHDNPFLNQITLFEPSTKEVVEAVKHDQMFIDKRIQKKVKDYDRIISLQSSLENALIEPRNAAGYYSPLYQRRAKNAQTNYYDQTYLWAGYEPNGKSGEVYFTEDEHKVVGEWIAKRKHRYLVVWALRGSMYQKATFWWARRVIEEFCERHPEALVVTMGDKLCRQIEFDHPQVVNKAGRWPFRQSLLFTKYADMVVTPETGLGVAAGTFGTSKIMLLTAASIKNVTGNDDNDFSLQSPAFCSPCTRAILDTYSCPTSGTADIESQYTLRGTKLPICVDFDPSVVLARMEEARECSLRRGRVEYDPTRKGAYA
jgi:ADP-heptose:LPS heptosyltransferase